MASSATQNVSSGAHIQALHHKTHHKPAAEKPAHGENFADMLAEADTVQPQKQAQPKEKTARTERPAVSQGAKEDTQAIKEDGATEETAKAAEPKTDAATEVPAEEKQAANDNETPDGLVPQAPVPETAKLKQAAQPAPEGDIAAVAKDAKTGLQHASLAPANDAEAGEAAPQDEAVTADFDKALQDIKPDAQLRAAEQPAQKMADIKPADLAAPVVANAPASHAPGLEKAHAATQAEAAQLPQPTPDVNQFAVEVAAKSQAGAKQFDIRLDPPELGRVEVRLSIDATGKAEAHLSADSAQTLDLLQKDASVLARALRDAGLNLSQDGLNFSLKNQNQQSGDDGHRAHAARAPASTQSQEPKQDEGSATLRRSLGLLDIKV